MAKWINSVISTGRLDVYNNIQGRWARIFRDGLSDINRLCRQYDIPIEFREVRDQDAANIVIATANGPTTFRHGSQAFRFSVEGSRLHGHMLPIGTGEIMQKAFIFLPENPMISAPRGSRPTGVKVMRAMQVHEYIHSIGLSDRDHSGNDIFTGQPTYRTGRSPDTDEAGIRSGPLVSSLFSKRPNAVENR